MRIAFVHYRRPARSARGCRAGEGPTEFLFGSIELERAGHDVTHYEVDPEAPTRRSPVGSSTDRRGRAPTTASLRRRCSAERARCSRPRDGRRRRRDHDRRPSRSRSGGALDACGRRSSGSSPAARAPGRTAGPERRRSPLLRRIHACSTARARHRDSLALEPRLGGVSTSIRFGVDTRFWSRAAGTIRRRRDRQRRAPGLGDAGPCRALVDARIRILTRHPGPDAVPDNVRWEPADWHRPLLSDAEVREGTARRPCRVPVGVPSRPARACRCRHRRARDPSSSPAPAASGTPKAFATVRTSGWCRPAMRTRSRAAVCRVLADPGATEARAPARASVAAGARLEGYAEADARRSVGQAVRGPEASTIYRLDESSPSDKAAAALVDANAAARRVGALLGHGA